MSLGKIPRWKQPRSFTFFVCLGLTSLWNIWGHITTVPACSSGTLTNVLPHRNAMPQTQDTTPHPVTVYRHGANLSLCYPSMWNVTLEYTATHFNVLGETRPGNPSPTFHTHQRTFNLMLSWWSTVASSVESTVPTGSWTRDLWCANSVRYPLAHSDFRRSFTQKELWTWRGLRIYAIMLTSSGFSVTQSPKFYQIFNTPESLWWSIGYSDHKKAIKLKILARLI